MHNHVGFGGAFVCFLHTLSLAVWKTVFGWVNICILQQNTFWPVLIAVKIPTHTLFTQIHRNKCNSAINYCVRTMTTDFGKQKRKTNQEVDFFVHRNDFGTADLYFSCNFIICPSMQCGWCFSRKPAVSHMNKMNSSHF